ncbi:MAG: metal ABC transporter permease [Planctomycetota bacterium]|jgi:manganese/zinc/iron transport system permease protein
MSWYVTDTWYVVIGALAAVSCGLLGNFMVLRRMSMMGDAISHAVLPGLAGAFLLTVWAQGAVDASETILPGWLESVIMMNARSGPVMFIGAAVVGILTALFTQVLHQVGRVDEGAAMGVVFTTLFALGLILMVRAADSVDLDPGCVLYGALELAPLDTVRVLGHHVPRAAVVLGIMTILAAIFTIVFYKELKITSFDPQLATTLGLNATIMHYLLMTLIAVTAVATFEAVGSILVVAMLIVPGATAHLLTDRLPSMLVVSVIVAIASAALGHLAAITVPTWFGYSDTITSGMMAATGGAIFAVVVVVAPRHGLLGRFLRLRVLRLRIIREDVLGVLYRLEELPRGRAPVADIAMLRRAVDAGPLLARLALRRLARRRRVERDAATGGFALTGRGRQIAVGLVRAHRMWEVYLDRHFDLPLDHLHDPAHRLEHVTDESLQRRLADESGRPTTDPHGTRVPD